MRRSSCLSRVPNAPSMSYSNTAGATLYRSDCVSGAACACTALLALPLAAPPPPEHLCCEFFIDPTVLLEHGDPSFLPSLAKGTIFWSRSPCLYNLSLKNGGYLIIGSAGGHVPILGHPVHLLHCHSLRTGSVNWTSEYSKAHDRSPLSHIHQTRSLDIDFAVPSKTQSGTPGSPRSACLRMSTQPPSMLSSTSILRV